MSIEWIDKIKMLYGVLADKESRDIYINRLNYLMTGNEIYIKNIVNKYLPKFKDCGTESDLYHIINEKHSNADIILYGAGEAAVRSLPYWRQLDKFKGFCDKDEMKQREGVDGIKVMPPEVLLNYYQNAVVIISTTKFEAEIKKFLIKNGFEKEQIYYLGEFSINFSDDQYFDKDVIQFSKEEVFVDAGSKDLNTSIEMKRYCPEVKKIYAFEPDSSNYQKCKQKKKDEKLDYIEIFPYGLWSTKCQLHFDATANGSSHLTNEGSTVVSVVTIDEVIRDKVTFIKMDIEGAELEALKGAKETIQRYKPKLAISIYHKPEDMTEIPLYIKELVPEYKLFIRHYSTSAGETILYAV